MKNFGLVIFSISLIISFKSNSFYQSWWISIPEVPPLPVFSKSLPEDQLNITADLKQTFLSPTTNQNLNPAAVSCKHHSIPFPNFYKKYPW